MVLVNIINAILSDSDPPMHTVVIDNAESFQWISHILAFCAIQLSDTERSRYR
jgi:hypothetical protein